MKISFRNLSGERVELSDIMPEDETFHTIVIEIGGVEYVLKNTQDTLNVSMDGQMTIIPRASNAVWLLDVESYYAKR